MYIVLIPHKEYNHYPPFNKELITMFLLMANKYKNNFVSELLCSVSPKGVSVLYTKAWQYLIICLSTSSWHVHAIIVPHRAAGQCHPSDEREGL